MSLPHWLIVVADLVLAALAAGHVLLNKSDPKAAMGWIAVCFLTPFVGSILYFLFGINRVVTRAQRLAAASPFQAGAGGLQPITEPTDLPPPIQELARIGNKATQKALLAGNDVRHLHNGEQAYPAMLEAINNACESVLMTTYIFDTRATGQQFIEALAQAVERGVDVRVIVDGIGEWGGMPRASQRLADRGIRVARFIPPRLIPPALSINLRNHRKILVVDNRSAFTGGMNISYKHLAADQDNLDRVTDMHFHLQGPVVEQIRQAFLEDWGFATDERESLSLQPTQKQVGQAYCRVISDGPNEDLDKLATVLLGVFSSAQQRIAIITPYFLPSLDMLAALRAAVLRGVEVTVILPAKSDHAVVYWATRKLLNLVISYGIQVFYQPPPFAHTKVLLIDDCYALIGSANLDPRSLRLNFEMNVEIYEQQFADHLWQHFDYLRSQSRQITSLELAQRSLLVKLRDGLAWLASPYL